MGIVTGDFEQLRNEFNGNITGKNIKKDNFGSSKKQLLNFVLKSTITDAGDLNDKSETAYTDWDITSLTSPTAVAVLLRVYLKDDTANSYCQFRKNGDTGVFCQLATINAYVANVYFQHDIVVHLDSNQILEYQLQDAGGSGPITDFAVSVLGWWEPANN